MVVNMRRAKETFLVLYVVSQTTIGALNMEKIAVVRPSPFSGIFSKISGPIRNRQTVPGTAIDRAFSNNTKLFVVGGFNGSRLARVEVLDLESLSADLNEVIPHPIGSYGMTVGEFQDVIKTCGGANNAKACHDYHPTDNRWVASTPMLHERYHHAASFIEDLWLLSGSAGLTDGFQTTEKWTGTAFEEGPALQRGMHGHCQLTINMTHIFFALADGQANYLLDWPNESFTELEPMMYLLSNPSCGLISNARNGREAVVAGFGKSQIFNFENMIWRIGPDAPYFFGAGYTQLSNTFVVVGGRNLSLDFLDTIYKFDNIKYSWIPLELKLKVAATSVGVVATSITTTQTTTTIITTTTTTSTTSTTTTVGPFGPDLAFNDHTKVVIIGGENRCELTHAELPQDKVNAFDLENPSKTCNEISNYPKVKVEIVAGVIGGIIKSCGGLPHPSNDCYDYHPESNTWVSSPNLASGRHAASFIDKVWLLSGGYSPLDEPQNTTEYWNGTAFEAGPDLLRPMGYHCQLTLNETHVFFADPAPVGPNYLLNWTDQTWTELPPIPVEMFNTMCGLIDNQFRGREAVVASKGQSRIFNFNDLEWRDGPPLDDLRLAGYTQVSDTFIIVGGRGPRNLGRIHKFNNINYTWEELNFQLPMSLCEYPGVVTVPDSFVSCK